MSEAKQRCQLVGCTRAASTRCFCCNKNVCTRHFTEHIDAVKAQIDPLANDINTMVEKIQGLTIEQITEASFAELQQWRMDMHQLIDEIFSDKHKEIDDLIENNKNEFVEHKKQQSKTMVKIQDDVKQLAEDGDATFEQIQLLRNQLAAVEISLTTFRKDFLSINAKVFAQGLVTVSSHLNKPSFIQNQQINQRRQRKLRPNSSATPTFPSPGISTPAQTNFTFGTPNAAHVGPTVITPVQQSIGHLFGGFGSNFPNNPSTHSSAATVSPFASVSTTASNPHSANSPFSAVAYGNNQPPFGNNPHFPFNKNGQK